MNEMTQTDYILGHSQMETRRLGRDRGFGVRRISRGAATL
jgi:hypothetical protein